MKIAIVAAAFSALSFALVPSSVQCQDMLANRNPDASLPQTAQPSEFRMATKPTDLPDAPQAAPMSQAGQASAHGMAPGPFLSQSFHDKFMTYAVGTAGPRALFVPAFPAAVRMANPPDHYPPAWRDGAQAFGRNYGDQLAIAAALETGRFAVGAVLHEDLRYHPSTSTNFFKRAGHALVFTFVDQSDDGHARPAFANFAGVAAGSYVGMSYLPTGFNDVTHADQRLAIQFGRLAGSNLGAEFAPDLIRFAMKRHLPRPVNPIPEWWTKR